MNTSTGNLRRRAFLTKTAQAALAASAAVPLAACAGEVGSRISYYKNGEIHVGVLGQPDGPPLTTGHMDFKPSWSQTGNMLVCFRRTKDDPVTVNWKSAIFIINADGSGLHLLSDGSHTDFNPTWTRDGHNAPIWNRKNDSGAGFHVMRGKVGGQPGEEVAITDDHMHTWAHSCLADGRIVVNSWHPTQGFGLFLLSLAAGAKPRYERVRCDLVPNGELHRLSVSPSEKKVCFEYLTGHKFKEPGHTLYVADFDAQQRAITNLKVIANEEGKPSWYAYPRWIQGESAVIYHLNSTGKGQLFVYQVADGSTRRVSTDPTADYRYPHGEAAPC